jgi:hypothetical protein
MGETQARNLAREIGLFVMPIEESGVARLVRGVLEVGPNASPDVIATIACRRQLEIDGLRGEAAVRELVEALGFAYVPTREQRERSDASGVAYRAVS